MNSLFGADFVMLAARDTINISLVLKNMLSTRLEQQQGLEQSPFAKMAFLWGQSAMNCEDSTV